MSKARDLADGTFDTDTLVVDAGNNRVGVGTSSPNGTLTVRNDSTNTEQLILGNSTNTGGRDWRLGRDNVATGDFIVKYSDATNSNVTTEAMRIDSNGCVTMPYQPTWRVSLASSQSFTGGAGYTRIDWNSNSQGSGFVTNVTFTTGRITVPVAGKYYVTLLLRSEITAFGNTDINIRLNGTEVNRWYQNNNSVNQYQQYGPVCAVLNMAANDYLETWISPQNSGQLSAGNNTVCFFMGHLIG